MENQKVFFSTTKKNVIFSRWGGVIGYLFLILRSLLEISYTKIGIVGIYKGKIIQ